VSDENAGSNAIQIGDIVEVQMSILLAPTSNHRFKTTLKLRAIAIKQQGRIHPQNNSINRTSHYKSFETKNRLWR